MDKKLLKVLLTSISGRYSHALFKEAQRQENADIINNDLLSLNKYRKEDLILWKSLSNKVLSPAQIKELWQQIGQKLQLCDLTTKFMVYLCQVKRLNLWPSIFQIYHFLEDSYKNKRQVLVESAYPLNLNERENLSQALKKIWANELALTFSVHPSLKTGLVVHSENSQLDISLNSYLTSLNSLLRKDK